LHLITRLWKYQYPAKLPIAVVVCYGTGVMFAEFPQARTLQDGAQIQENIFKRWFREREMANEARLIARYPSSRRTAATHNDYAMIRKVRNFAALICASPSSHVPR
jgi:hypothetical protein